MTLLAHNHSFIYLYIQSTSVFLLHFTFSFLKIYLLHVQPCVIHVSQIQWSNRLEKYTTNAFLSKEKYIVNTIEKYIVNTIEEYTVDTMEKNTVDTMEKYTVDKIAQYTVITIGSIQ